jgi:hypothetical protein
MTRSTNFPILDAGSGAYYQTSILGYRTVCIMKFTNNGVRLWSTYYGGSTNDYGLAIATNISGKVFVTGNTSSTNFPVLDMGGGAYYQPTSAGSDDAFILRFSNTGIREWATHYGGSTGDIARTIATDDSGNIFIAGNTLSSSFPTYDPGNGAYYQSTLTGGHEIFILGFNRTGARQWATFYGGASTDYGMSIATDNNDNIYLTGFTLSSAFPTYNPGGSAYFQGTNAGSYDAYVLKFASASTGIEENREPLTALRSPLKIYPNPAKTYFVVNGPWSMDHRTIKIYDVTGKLVKVEKSKGLKETRIPLDGIKNGIYFIKVGSELAKEKLVITR